MSEMRVNVEGEKYTICSNAKGEVWLERDGVRWVDDPDAQKVWLSVAYELYCLRRIAKAAIEINTAANNGTSDFLRSWMRPLNDVIAHVEGECDYERNLDDPGKV